MTPVHVLNDHSLGVVSHSTINGVPVRRFEILASKPQLGAIFNRTDGPILLHSTDELRPAARKDFDFFRVSWRGYRLAPDPKADHSLFGRF